MTKARRSDQSQETLSAPEAPEARPVTVKLLHARRRRRSAASAAVVEPARPGGDATTEPALPGGADAHDAPPASLPLIDPKRWDRYEIVRLLGRGGMGAVYEARDKRLDRGVAIKFINSADPMTTRRFLQEARAQARIDHPNVCKVLEVGEVEGKAYIAMQLIRGESLLDAARSMTLDEKVRVMKTVAEAVHAAHRLGIIHRDIKPSNVMVEAAAGAAGAAGRRPVLMDFGLAREASDAKGLTESGAIMGTPAYMPPEQARGSVRAIDARSDVYSLGATLYDVIADAPPFSDDEAVNILLKVLIQEPVPLRVKVPGIPPALDIIVGKCLNKEPHLRYATAADLADDLERYLSRERVHARRLGLPTRLYWRAKRNKPMAVAVAALIVTLLTFAGYGARTVIVDARNEAVARRRAELAQKLGQAVKELEWRVRSAYLVPLHDTGPEKAQVRARMAAIDSDMRSFGDLAAGLEHYALGRGHLALQEWEEARSHLEKAEELGVGEAELHYALGRALGELYIRALDDARRSGDKSYFEKRKAEIEREYLAPALSRLERCRGIEGAPASYLEGLIHFYHGRYDEALREAAHAGSELPWLYEAAKLEGDVFMARALNSKDRGESEAAERDFTQAVARYERAADVGRSDHQLYEALAEAWIRQEEMDLFRGRDPATKLERALEAADKALAAAPTESHGSTKKAFAYDFQAQYAESHGSPSAEVGRLRQAQITAGNEAITLHPDDAYAQEITGLAYTRIADRAVTLGEPVERLLDQAYTHFKEAIRINPRFPWAYNDYGMAIGYSGASARQRNADARGALQRAIDTTKKAIELDDGYVLAYNNASVWLTELAQWEADHGESPEASLHEAIAMADRALRLNGTQPFALGNAGLAFTQIALYRLDAGEDGREPAQQAIERFKGLLAIDPNLILAHRDLAHAYYLMANHERIQGVDSAPSLDEGLREAEKCARLDPRSADCALAEAELRGEQAQRARSKRLPGEGLLDQAQKLARDAAERAPERADLWLGLANICLLRAAALSADPGSKAPMSAVVKEGLRSIQLALKRAPGLARSLAIEGALHFYAAGADPAQERAALDQARARLSEAFAANPTLERRFGAIAADVERRLKKP